MGPDDSFTATFGASGQLSTVVEGSQFATGQVGLAMFDEDIGEEDSGGGWTLGRPNLPATNITLDHKSDNEGVGVKSITYSLVPAN